MHTLKPQLKQELPVGKKWNEIIPLLAETTESEELDKTRAALRQAQMIIQAHEQRIHVLEKMALTDELTGLANRRAFMSSFSRELSLAKRQPAACGVLLMIDLDNFKSINDQWGHQTGDDYLCTVAATLRRHVRESDIVARLGGDEFAVLLTHIDERGGTERAAHLEEILNSSFMIRPDHAPHRIALRASFGLAAYDSRDTADKVLEAADIRLYEHKAQNRHPSYQAGSTEIQSGLNFCPFI